MRLPPSQGVASARLRKELDCSCLHCAHRHGDVAVAGDEDDRHVIPIGDDTPLQIEPVEIRKCNVKYQATRTKDPWVREEFPCGREDFRLPAGAEDKGFQGVSRRDVGVDREHDRSHVRHSG